MDFPITDLAKPTRCAYQWQTKFNESGARSRRMTTDKGICNVIIVNCQQLPVTWWKFALDCVLHATQHCIRSAPRNSKETCAEEEQHEDRKLHCTQTGWKLCFKPTHATKQGGEVPCIQRRRLCIERNNMSVDEWINKYSRRSSRKLAVTG